MNSMYAMSFYAWHDEGDGMIHVQNVVGGLEGQHHVHTPEQFEEWRKPDDKIVWIDEERPVKPCDCGLAPGEKLQR